MLELKELLGKYKESEVPEKVLISLKVLLVKLNVIRKAWGKPMTVTSGYRSEADQKRINPKAIKSNHLTGHAVDIYDPNLKLTAWLKKGEGARLLVEQGLYCEEGNKNWVHFQDIAPRSGNRWFLP